VFVENDILYVGVKNHGVMSCDALTGEVGPAIISGTGFIRGLSFSQSPLNTPQSTPLTHTLNFTVPAPKPWTSSTHALWPLPAQHIVHMAVVVMWKTYMINLQTYLPPELVWIILQSVVTPSKPGISNIHANSDESKSGSECSADSESEYQDDEG
jgi:hypothetical protein